MSGVKAMNEVAIAICTGKNVPVEFLHELLKLYSTHDYLTTVLVSGLYIQLNRSRAVKQALEARWDYLLFLDDDMVLPDNLIDRVRGYTEPVVGGLYVRRTWPDVKPVPGQWAPEIDGPFYHPLTADQLRPMLDEPGLYDCDVLGTGCLAVRRDVLADWPEDEIGPMFAVDSSPDGLEIIGEDLHFCWQLKQQGIQPKLDTALDLGHLGTVPITKDFFLTQAAMRAS